MRRIARGNPDYWDHATLLELAVLAADQQNAIAALINALAAIRDIFEPDTTANNLAMILEAKERRGESQAWMVKILEKLRERAKPKATAPEPESNVGP
jgi:hypothetical protein